MKKSILILWILSLIVFNGCNGISTFRGIMTYELDNNLPNIGEINALATIDSVGFEWQKIAKDTRIQGIHVYRGDPLQNVSRYQRIGTINNIYATHFVDTHVEPDNTYSYVFTTFYMARESRPSKKIDVRTLASFEAISFVEAYHESPNTIKILWKPHPNASVNSYIIEQSVNGGTWRFLSQIRGQLMVEYIDKFAKAHTTYSYRVIAQSYNKINSAPSDASTPIKM
ncbi:MAG: hypothetical protein QM493_00785 [Sulfurovum sp.]